MKECPMGLIHAAGLIGDFTPCVRILRTMRIIADDFTIVDQENRTLMACILKQLNLDRKNGIDGLLPRNHLMLMT